MRSFTLCAWFSTLCCYFVERTQLGETKTENLTFNRSHCTIFMCWPRVCVCVFTLNYSLNVLTDSFGMQCTNCTNFSTIYHRTHIGQPILYTPNFLTKLFVQLGTVGMLCFYGASCSNVREPFNSSNSQKKQQFFRARALVCSCVCVCVNENTFTSCICTANRANINSNSIEWCVLQQKKQTSWSLHSLGTHCRYVGGQSRLRRNDKSETPHTHTHSCTQLPVLSPMKTRSEITQKKNFTLHLLTL